MRRLGVHTSIAGGLHLAIRRAHELGCSAVQIFSHNPRGWLLTEMPGAETELFSEFRKKYDIEPVYVHCSYLINLSSSSPPVREKSVVLLREELRRADALGADFVILHLHGGEKESAMTVEGIKEALALRSAAPLSFRAAAPLFLRAAARSAGKRVAPARNLKKGICDPGLKKAGLLIENTARSSMKDLYRVIKGAGGLISGVVIDTCHAFAAGYELTAAKGLERLVNEANDYFGPGGVRLIHLNDSKGACGSGIDRHEHIGRGRIGSAALGALVLHKSFRDVPLVLETPRKDPGDDPMNLKAVREILKMPHG